MHSSQSCARISAEEETLTIINRWAKLIEVERK